MIRKKIPVFVIAFFVLVSFTAAVAADSPREAIKTTIDSVLNTLKDKGLSAKKKERRNKIRTLLKSRFDYEEMAKLTLARHWQKRSPDEKKEFISIFSDLLESSYMGKIEAYTDEKITYDKEILRGGDSGVVNTTIVTKNVSIPIEYKVMLKDSQWWVYDVVIEGVSLVSTYRNQYNKIIVGESYAELVKKMKNKLDEVNTLLEKETTAKNL